MFVSTFLGLAFAAGVSDDAGTIAIDNQAGIGNLDAAVTAMNLHDVYNGLAARLAATRTPWNS